ncbi:MAG: DNA repair protein RecO (recombination protein O) [Polaribacter sp.]|jgi:DNA repair protein RecO (recombination protein O)
MQNETTKAFILHSRPFKETSLILHCFTQKFGSMSLIAQGIKRKNSQAKRAILQPFNLLQVQFTGKGELKILCDSELIEFKPQPKGNALACCYYLNELMLRALEEWQEYPELFSLYTDLIQQFNLCGKKNMAVMLRNFEIALVTFLGLSPDWEYDIEEKTIDNNSYYEYISENGFQKIEQPKRTHTQNIFSGKTLLSISRRDFLDIDMKECQRITQRLIRPLIGNRPLESRKMWLQ